jgi:peptidoglycan hydrolase-like protein with peptidoglycan-binding domain
MLSSSVLYSGILVPHYSSFLYSMKKIALLIALAVLVGSCGSTALAQSQAASTAPGQLKKQLKHGSRGNDVTILQTFLAADPTLYPEGLVTGYFGPATSKAIMKFQAKYGISQVGTVGPQTLKKLN